MSEAMHAPLGGLFRMAVVSGTPALVLTHLRRGANVNARDASGATPLMLAMARGRADICQLLLDEGADPRLLDAAGRSVLFYAKPDAGDWISELIPVEAREPLAVVEEPPTVEPIMAVATLATSDRATMLTGDDILDEAIDEDGGWEPEEVTAAPADDISLRQATAELQVQIARHRAIDSDPDWADIEIDLPSPAPRRVRNPVRLRELERVRSVFRRALTQGSYAPEEIEAALVGDPAEDEGALRRLRAAFDTLATLGTVREDWDDWRPAGASRARLSADVLDEACEYFELHWSREDIVDAALRRLAKFPPARAEEDRQAWRRYDLALQSLCAAIADSPTASAALAVGLSAQARRLVWTDRSGGVQDEADSGELGEDDMDAEEPARAEVPAHGWSEDQLAEASATLIQLSQLQGSERDAQRQAFLSGLGERRLPGSLLIFIPGLEDVATTRAALRSFLKARDFLFDANSRLAMWLARRYGWSRLPLEDRYQEASQGLLRAIDRFDSRRGNKFSSYAVWWIRQSVTRAIQDLERVIRLPVHLQETLRRVDRQAELLTYELAREPTTAELAQRLALDPERLVKLLRGRADAVPLEDLAQTEKAGDPARSLAEGDTDPEHGLIRAQLEAAIRATLAELTPREERIVRQRFGLNLSSDMTLEEIGVTVDVTRERIRQIEAKALRRMAHPAKSRRLRPFLEAGA